MDGNYDPAKSPPNKVHSDLQAGYVYTLLPSSLSSMSGGNKVKEITCQKKQNKTKRQNNNNNKTLAALALCTSCTPPRPWK